MQYKKYILNFDDFLFNEAYDNASLKNNNYFKTRKSADNIGIKLFKDWYDKLSLDEKNIIEWYRDSGYMEIANKLFDFNIKDYTVSEEEIQNKIFFLQSILNKSKLKKDLVVYKGIRNGILFDKIKSMSVGDTIYFPNFISTTLHFQYALNAFTHSKDKIVLKINLPKKTECAFVSFDMAESEIIINKNTTLKLKSIEKKEITYNKNDSYLLYEFDIFYEN